jgi:hypothetical protein
MARNKKRTTGKSAAHEAGYRSYYDPATEPGPRKMPRATGARRLPVTMSRSDRRARAKMTFSEQRALAAAQGFAIPPEVTLAAGAGADFWRTTWEALYAART